MLQFITPLLQRLHCSKVERQSRVNNCPCFQNSQRWPQGKSKFFLKLPMLLHTSYFAFHSVFMFNIMQIFFPLKLLVFQEHAMLFSPASNLPFSLRLRVQALQSCLIGVDISTQHRAGPDIFNTYSSGGITVKGKTVSFGTKQTQVRITVLSLTVG